jgi:hypothetical protein
MPEHDLFDLDALFAGLEQDVAGITHGPGAQRAVSAARRRRRTTIGAVAAATVLAVGGAAIAQGVGRHDPQTISPTSLPAPAPLTAAALSEATAGWTSAWSSQTARQAQLVPGPTIGCLDRSTELNDGAEPSRGSGNLFFAAGETSAFATLIDFAGRPDTSDRLWSSLSAALGSCDTAMPARQLAWDGGEARSFAVVSAHGKVEHAWIAHESTTIAIAWVSGAPSDVPVTADDGVSQALVAALQVPETFRGVRGSVGSSSSSASEAVPVVSPLEIADALGDWQSGWATTRSAVPDADSSPCRTDLTGGAAFGDEQVLGANGELNLRRFDTAAEASSAMQGIGDALAACAATSYDVHTVPLAKGGSVTVAAATGEGNDVVWMVRDGRRFAQAVIPAGDTVPPDAVTAKVGEVLLAEARADETGPNQR